MKRLALLVCVVAFGATGCGSAESHGDIKLIVASAPDKTRAADTAKMQMVFKAVGDSDESITFNGEVDFAHEVASMTLEIDDIKGDVVFDKQAMYQRIPSANLPIGKEWVRFDFAELDRLAGGTGEAGTFSPAQQDPTATLEQLRDADDITKIGPETVRHTPTTHYRAIIDLKEGAAAGGLEGIQAQKMIDQLHLSTMPLDVWIDEAGRVWRIAQEIDFSKSEYAEGDDGFQKAVFSVDYYDFGTKVNVKIPDADDTVSVLDVPELFE